MNVRKTRFNDFNRFAISTISTWEIQCEAAAAMNKEIRSCKNDNNNGNESRKNIKYRNSNAFLCGRVSRTMRLWRKNNATKSETLKINGKRIQGETRQSEVKRASETRLGLVVTVAVSLCLKLILTFQPAHKARWQRQPRSPTASSGDHQRNLLLLLSFVFFFLFFFNFCCSPLRF